MDKCHLLRPEWLWLIIPLVVLLILLYQRRQQTGNWRQVVDSRLLPFMLQGAESKRSYLPLLLTTAIGLLSIFSLAGPACEQREQPVFRDQSALVVALDLSHSMNATDIKPSRLARARLKLIDILKSRKEGQTALIVYAAGAFTVSPLTDDANTVASLVNSLDTNMMPAQGSNTTIAIQKAAQLLQQAGSPRGDILLITDGLNQNRMQTSIEAISQYQYRVSVLAVGTAAGAPIAQTGSGFLKDRQGTIVIPKLDEKPLRQLASESSGRYHQITTDDRDIQYLLGNTKVRSNPETALDDLKTDQWYEEGPWLLLLVLPLAALAFRRGALAVFVILVMPLPDDAYALDMQQLWLNKNQQAQQKLSQGDAKQAAELFQSPQWKAAAQYRAGEYQKSIETLKNIDTADALYNKANALAKLNQFPQAIEAYEQALKREPEHQDAKYNRDLIKQQMQNQEQNQNQNQEQNSQSDKQEQNNQDSKDGNSGNDGQQKQDQEQSQLNDQSSGSQNNQANEKKDASQQAQPNQSDQEKTERNQSEDSKVQQAEKNKANKNNKQAEQDKAVEEQSEISEKDIATQQWLRRIPDDPGGLLRRKFQYQYQQQSQTNDNESDPW